MLLGENWCWSLLGPKGLIVPIMLPYSLWNLTNHTSMTKSQLCVKQICLLSIIWNVTNNKSELWKTVKLTSFQKPQSQSVSIFFKFVHQCPLLYLLCYLYILQFHVLSGYCGSDHYTFLGNCPPTPSPKPTLTLTSHVGQNVGLLEG